LPWDELTSFCLGTLRLAPDAFWALTPREIAALLGRAEATGRDDLARLMGAYPDRGG
jgi:uncharacterized phage protein (TIGR02216 family)